MAYLMRLLHRKSSRLSFESLDCPDVLSNISMMLSALPVLDDDYLCETTAAQKEVENSVREVYESLRESNHLNDSEFSNSSDLNSSAFDAPLDVHHHLSYIENMVSSPLPAGFYVLDSSHTWMVYWLLNAHAVLSGDPVSPELRIRASATLNKLILQDGAGGVAGGPGSQIGHVALAYAAVLTLALIEDYATLHRIRPNIYKWLLSLKHADGSFSMHLGGECDTRSTYCVLTVASLLGVLTPELVANTAEWILSCQTYEGGFAGVPDAEAHGGYTFCAVASMFLLPGQIHNVNMPLLVRWLAARQLQLEGGFSGRTNKLVDACYAFWVGASVCLAECATGEASLFNRPALKSYILNCCQEKTGGLRDKIGKRPDFYHTNYALCGLSTAEHTYTLSAMDAYSFDTTEYSEGSAYTAPVNPVFGLPMGSAEKCREHFSGRMLEQIEPN